MYPGATVFYRLNEWDASEVNNFRKAHTSYIDTLIASKDPDDELLRKLLGNSRTAHAGDEVAKGELLPATVVRMYSMAEVWDRIIFDVDAPGVAYKDRPKTFGAADLRVLLPGSDVLFKRLVQQGDLVDKRTDPWGVTGLPKPGYFTTACPAELIS